jgi:hypothetical protein
MPHKVKVSGSRSLKKGSKKNSKKNSKSKVTKKHTGMDFTSILNDMSGHKSSMANMMGPEQMQNQMMDPSAMMQQGMQMDQSAMMMQQQAAMQGQMMDPSMMMMGKNAQSAQGAQGAQGAQNSEQEIDPLHIQYIVPQNKNLNINNYGISYDQLLRGSQHNGLADTFNSPNSNSIQNKMNDMNIN